MNIRLRLIVLLLLAFNVDLLAQHPSYWHLTDDNGLNSNTVYDLLQDKRGFVWIGTDNGLVQFSGQGFKTYHSINQKSTELTNLIEDSIGRIWGINFSRQLFYVEKDSLKELAIPNIINNLTGHLSLELINEWLYVYLPQHIFRYHISKKTWDKDFYSEHWPINTIGERENVYTISHQSNAVYICFVREIHMLENGQTKAIYKAQLNESIIASNWQDSMLIVRKTNTEGVLLFDEKLNKIQNKVNPFEIFNDSTARILNSTVDKNGFWWMCTTNGAIAPFNKHSKKIYFPNDQISDVIIDREGSLWFSSLQNGLYIVPSADVMLYNSVNSKLANDNIQSLYENDGSIYLGFAQGEFQKIIHGTLSDTGFIAVRKGINGFAKIGNSTLSYGDYIYDIQSKERLWYPFYRNIKSIKTLKEGYCGILMSDRLYLNPINNQNTNMLDQLGVNEKSIGYSASGKISLNQLGIRSFEYDSTTKTLYIASYAGLSAYSVAGKKEIKTKEGQSIFARQLVLKDGKLWASTSDKGILLIENLQHVISYNENHLLGSNNCEKLCIDGDTIWSNCDKGLIRLIPEEESVEVFNRSDGLPSLNINDLLEYNNKLWLATSKGLVQINKNYSSINKHAPYIEINKIQLNDQFVSDIKKLAAHENNLAFHISTAVSFKNRGEGSLFYRLRGLSDTWQKTDIDQAVISYQALAANEYTFEAYSTNEDGVKSKSINITFSIIPPLWQRWWFIALLILLVILIAVILLKMRFKSIAERNKIQQDLRASKLTAIKAQMNPHFVFNALNSIQEYVFLHQTELANDYLGKFARLMRKTLELSDQMSISLEEEVEVLNLYLELEAIRFEDSFSYELKLAENINKREIQFPAMLIQPFVENAIKHGLLHKKDGRELSIHFYLKKNALHCDIKDNGIGIKASKALNARKNPKHRSFGTSAIRNRIELLNMERAKPIEISTLDLMNVDNKACGTQVLICIPLNETDA